MWSSSDSFVQALGWTLLHSVWQAMLISACLWLLMRLCRRAAAAVRYLLSLSALAAAGAWFLFTFFRLWHPLPAGERLPLLPAAALQAYPAVLPVAPPPAPVPLWAEINTWLPYLVGCYVLGLLFRTLRLGREGWQLRRIRTRRAIPFDPAWEHYLEKLAAQLHITKRVQLFLSAHIDVPLMTGHLKPVIYLPLSLASQLSPEQIEAILLHELAHIRRHDYLLNLLQQMTETLLFFNPFIWLISRHIRLERENACDEIVTRSTAPLTYAHTLVAVEEYRRQQHQIAMAVTGRRHQLFCRIRHIMEKRVQKTSITQKLLALLVLAGGIASVAWLTPEEGHNAIRHRSSGSTHATPLSADVTLQAAVPVFIPLPAPAPGAAPAPRADTTAPRNGTDDLKNEDEARQRLNESRERWNEELEHYHQRKADAQQQVDSMLRQLEKSQLQAGRQALAEARRQLRQTNWDSIRQSSMEAVRRAQAEMQHINWDSLQRQTSKAMAEAQRRFRETDWEKIRQSSMEALSKMQGELQRMNWDSIRQQTGKAMEEARRQLRQTNWDSIRQSSMEALRHAQANLQRTNWDSLRRQMESSLRQADTAIKRAKWNRQDKPVAPNASPLPPAPPDSLSGPVPAAPRNPGSIIVATKVSGRIFGDAQAGDFRSPVTEVLKRHGLLKDNIHYTVMMNDRALYINGKKQPQTLFEQCRKLTEDGKQLLLTFNGSSGKALAIVQAEKLSK